MADTAYATVEEVAGFTNASVDAVKDVQLESIATIIDNWRGGLYPENPQVITERHSGTGTSKSIFLDNVQIDSITSVKESEDVVDAANYELMYDGMVRRIDGYCWRFGDMNIVVTAETRAYPDTLRSATCQIWQLFYTRNKLGGLIRTYPGRIREYTDGGGAVTGYDSLERAIKDVLETTLPRLGVLR